MAKAKGPVSVRERRNKQVPPPSTTITPPEEPAHTPPIVLSMETPSVSAAATIQGDAPRSPAENRGQPASELIESVAKALQEALAACEARDLPEVVSKIEMILGWLRNLSSSSIDEPVVVFLTGARTFAQGGSKQSAETFLEHAQDELTRRSIDAAV